MPVPSLQVQHSETKAGFASCSPTFSPFCFLPLSFPCSSYFLFLLFLFPSKDKYLKYFYYDCWTFLSSHMTLWNEIQLLCIVQDRHIWELGNIHLTRALLFSFPSSLFLFCFFNNYCFLCWR